MEILATCEARRSEGDVGERRSKWGNGMSGDSRLHPSFRKEGQGQWEDKEKEKERRG